MLNWPRRIADFKGVLRRLFCPRRPHSAPPRTRLGLESLCPRVLFSANLPTGVPVPFFNHADAAPRLAHASPADGELYEYDRGLLGVAAQPTADGNIQPGGAGPGGDVKPYMVDHYGPADRGDVVGAYERLYPADYLEALNPPGAAPALGDGASTPSEAPAAHDSSRRTKEGLAETPAPPGRLDGGGIADELVAGDAASSAGTVEIDPSNPDGQTAGLLVVDWTVPDAREELTALKKANLAFVPTYVVKDAPPTAPRPAPANGAADLALTGAIVGPEQRRPSAHDADGDAAPLAQDPSPGRQQVVDHIFQGTPVAPEGDGPFSDAAMYLAAQLKWIALQIGQWLVELPHAPGDDQTAAFVTVEALLVFGAWRLTEPDNGAAE